MPKRSNPFQQMIARLYSELAPFGARVSESALLRECDGGAEREVDILIEHEVAGIAIKIAVECRKHGRDQTIEWIDSLIGKYSRLHVNKIVAVSETRFTKAARTKASAHNIELIKLTTALTVNWKAKVEQWRFMTESHTLMRVITHDEVGNILTFTDVSPDGKTPTHRDDLSREFYSVIKPWFFGGLNRWVAAEIRKIMQPHWQTYIDDPTPRWCEVSLPVAPGQIRLAGGEDVGIRKIFFGIGTHIHVASPTNHARLGNVAISTAKFKMLDRRMDMTIHVTTDESLKSMKFSLGEGWRKN